MNSEKSIQIYSIASLVCGVLSLFSILTVVFAIPLGALSILFAVMAHRQKREFTSQVKIGIATSVISMLITGVILVTTIISLPTLLQSEEYREQLNTTSEQMYGMSFDELMNDYYGIDLDSYIEKWN